MGRSAELDSLHELRRRAGSGIAAVALVEGGGGMGKSTLLHRFAREAAAEDGDAVVLARASGADAERLLPYGLLTQLVATSAAVVPDAVPHPANWSAGTDPLAAGADLLALLGGLQGCDRSVLLVVDDLHWADMPSARALLFALRRLYSDRVLAVLSSRPAELARLGEGWQRFVAGDPRVHRTTLPGLTVAELVTLADAMALGPLSARAAGRLREQTGGNPLYCTALLRELGPAALERGEEPLPAPRSLADLLVARMGSLSAPAQDLLAAAAVLGQRSTLPVVAALAEVTDPWLALDEAVDAGLLTAPRGAGTEVAFAHALTRAAIYDSLRPARRGRLHARAAQLVSGQGALAHRVAAASGPDATLVADLVAAARTLQEQGRTAESAGLLRQAAALSAEPGEPERLRLDALENLLGCGDIAQAQDLVGELPDATPSVRRDVLLGGLDLYLGRTAAAQRRLRAAWDHSAGERDAAIGAAAATMLTLCSFYAGGLDEAVAWGDRALAVEGAQPATHVAASALRAVSLLLTGGGLDALAPLQELTASPADVPLEQTDALVVAGAALVWGEQLDRAASVLRLCAGRLRSGTPLSYASLCLGHLAEVEFRLGRWDDAVAHSTLAVSLSNDAARAWDLPIVHSYAALVPARRGEWARAAEHVAVARHAAATVGGAVPIVAAATAEATLALSRGELDEVLRVTDGVHAVRNAELLGHPDAYDWRALEAEALLGQGELSRAEALLDRLEAALDPQRTTTGSLTAVRLRGLLHAHRDDAEQAAELLIDALPGVDATARPFPVAQVELSTGQMLRRCGRRAEAIARIRSARALFVGLGAHPSVQACDRELAGLGAAVRPATPAAVLGLTPTELVVARMVASGRTNREVAAELFVSVKAIEFHLRNIFTKLDLRSRHDLAGRLAPPPAAENLSGTT